MRFLYDENAGNDCLEVKGDNFNHLKARRVSVGERLDIRNLKDGYSYLYEIKEFSRKAVCELVFKSLAKNYESDLTLAWAVVQPSVIEKALPSLNEIGVTKILFVYTDFSQKNIKLDFDRFERILIGSSEQCGRNSIIKFEIFASVSELLKVYENVSLVDFGGVNLDAASKNEILFVGSEGGFSDAERTKFAKSYALNSPNILRSNTAIISVAAKMLL
ncbi:16S ribosomal RNA methyltransferase RsmE [Campylobacter hyointestinalis subsp. hyointestinalis]|uniref:Ribosomal RNA small subunit methyltransferase E n=1 Tax=Campylobacter hyointestinalis subsp. hyointestinalis TaxID=91352 RepID=A0A0S4S6C4_CAMHY|nr:16S rRNA (uracil(1498)-N(3))-methyltransferase [Campylobacter hyointestinalis]CUU81181.1 16S ribosomal RNA methyltransferase RsmE [Campylobacter hyointestinalis subsp. hyointestinalis]CUU81429.1 16S ribosomal RNA methyltransferase RsmE [Campylobacter hyointestinalis subsp. hyointestinalis]CUU82206.1 16S ribosomal RNA methyltransferase RsmE [Campylobacter hyointestinalis subsp. hyointestinalis]CUU90139.1 16S ribosomal RNA methyltransferase RsmE [Campylobacter hyointestinalis subsp. hyointesti